MGEPSVPAMTTPSEFESAPPERSVGKSLMFCGGPP
jgi:hypothetical protein